jgi:steroid 5-alpha reductase family enzyme
VLPTVHSAPPLVARLDWADLAAPALVVAAAFVALWAWQLRSGDAGIVDVGWAGAIAALAVWYGLNGDGSAGQRALAVVAGGTWGVRLASHLLVDRLLAAHEDGRYAHLRSHWGRRAPLGFLWFFVAQAALAVGFSMPFFVVAQHDAALPSSVQIVGLLVGSVGMTIEVVADRQLARFRRDPRHRGRTCRVGLWRWSRHPNYFGEWLIWVGFALIALPAPHGSWMLATPVAMYLFLTRVTGIPYTEAQALRSRGDDYRDYQRSTSAFFPWPPRRGS